MTARPMMLVLAGGCLALAPLALAQDHAVPRGGGGGGGSTGSGAHPGVSSSSGGSGGSTYTPSGGSSSGSGTSGSSSTAERRHPRAGTGTGGRGGHGGYGGYGGYYPYYGYGSGYYYPGWGWGSYWWPYGSWGWYGGYWGYPWGWGAGTTYHYVQHDTGSIRVLVEPSEARVYVDGYYAGTVDDFDGLFQRLHVSPGRHEVTLKLEGYKTHRMKVYVPPDGTLKLHYSMQQGSGESFEDLAGTVPDRELQRDRERQREQDERWSGREPQTQEDQTRAAAGKLRLDIKPSDASVYVDGAFRGSAREAATLQLPPGRHQVEVVRPGYRTVERQVDVAPGEPTEVAIELERSGI